MFRNKSVLVQTLLAVSVPLAVVFVLILFLSARILREGGEMFAREIIGNFAEQVSIRIEDRLAVMYTSLNMTRRSLEAIDYDAADARERAEGVLRNTLLSSEGVYSAWLAFEPDAFGDGDGRFITSFLKSGRYVTESNHLVPAMLENIEASPWYDFPLRSGSNFFVVAERYNYGQGEGDVYRGTLSFPVTRDGMVIGCVGIDILYRQVLNFFPDLKIMGQHRTMSLITSGGDVIYSTGAPDRSVLANADDIAKTLEAGHTVLLRHAVSPANGENVFICLASINLARSNQQPLLYIELPASALTARSLPLIRSMSLVTLLAFLLLGVGIYLVVRGVVSRVKELTLKADAIAQGDLDIDFGGDGGVTGVARNELVRLRQALKQMVRQLGSVNELKLAAVRAEVEKEKLAETNAVKSRFFATMSHEIRTPMNAITGLSELLLARPLGSEEKSYIQDIRISAISLLRIINDILDSSKMEEGRFELRKVHFNLRATLSNLDSVIHIMAKQKGLDYHSNFTRAPEYVQGDEERIRQILLNILSNAVKYTPEGKVVFMAAEDGGTLRFVVSDTGLGIKEEELPYVFDPFRRAGNGAAAIEGTGLGLNITRQLVELMGGGISVRSAYGRGSVFKVEIPYEPGDRALAKDDVPLSAGTAEERRDVAVLVVDDNPVNLKVACGFLRLSGIEADTAESGMEALDRAGVRKYDLVFMDHMMPGMDGVEAMRAIRASGGLNGKTPVIALTANVMGDIRQELLDEGMDDFLAKPVEMAALRQVLARWLPRTGGETGNGA